MVILLAYISIIKIPKQITFVIWAYLLNNSFDFSLLKKFD